MKPEQDERLAQPIHFHEIAAKVRRFEDYIQAAGVRINPSSVLRRYLDSAYRLPDTRHSELLPMGEEGDEFFRAATEAEILADTILPATETPFEPALRRALPRLRKGDPGRLYRASRTQDRDRVYELLVACRAATFASEVALEAPCDVTCSVGGRRWGLECKALYGSNDTIIASLKKGRKQVNESTVDCGVVVVDATGVYPRERLLWHGGNRGGVLRTFLSFEKPMKEIDRYMEEIAIPLVVGLDSPRTPGDPAVWRKCLGVTFDIYALARLKGMTFFKPCFRGISHGDRDKEFTDLCHRLSRSEDPPTHFTGPGLK